MADIKVDTLKELKTDNFSFNESTQFSNISNKDLLIVTKSLSGTSPATASNYGVIFIAKIAVEVVYIAVTWGVASTSGTLNLERLSDIEAKDNGDEIFIATVDTSGTANTVNIKKGKDLQNTKLKTGDRLALKDSGTLTNLDDLSVTIYLKPIAKGDYR